ncbi:hypothetical protein G6L37_01410 [Agrobacterium rubi]|nr:hypothetical protein [Agrobacterium rubi]NTF24050.1 hypothetical protein [Agrobacterium rubi]
MSTDLIGNVISLIRENPLVMNNEKRLQDEIEKLLLGHGVANKREVDLGDGDVIDFMLPFGVGLEVKIKEGKRAIYRQCKRYCSHDQVTNLILVSGTALGFPAEIDDKPCYVVSLGAGWL